MKSFTLIILLFGAVSSFAENVNVTIPNDNPEELVQLVVKWDMKKIYPDILEVEYSNIRAEGTDGSFYPILAIDSNNRVRDENINTLCRLLGHDKQVTNYVRHITHVRYETSTPPRKLYITQEEDQSFNFSLVKDSNPFRIFDFRCKDNSEL